MTKPIPITLYLLASHPPSVYAPTPNEFRHPDYMQDNNILVIEFDHCEKYSDNFIGNYIQLLENKILNNRMLQNCLLNNSIFYITIQK